MRWFGRFVEVVVCWWFFYLGLFLILYCVWIVFGW